MKTINIVILFWGLFLLFGCSSNDKYLEQGMNELQNKQYKSAIDFFKEGLARKPKQPELYYYGLANCYYYLKKYESARVELKDAINLNKNHRDSHWLMARIFSKKGDFKNSLDYYNKAISINSNSMLLASRGLIYLRMGDFESALIDLDQAIEQNPNDKYALSNRGLVKIKFDRLQEADLDLQKSMHIDKNNPYVYKHIALLNLAMLDTVKACENLHISREKGYSNYGNEIDKNEVNDLLEQHCK